MPLTASDVANKQFTTVKLREGYNMEEVDGFLDEVEAELGRLHREIDDLTAKAAAAVAMPAPPPVVVEPPAPVAGPAAPSDQAVRMLELAQKTADEHVAGAKAEAERLLSEARAAHQRAMGDLESERTAMQAKVDELRAFEKEYRTRLRSYLEGQLRDLEAKAVVPPAPAAAPAAPAPAPTPTPAPAPAQSSSGQPQQSGQPRPFTPAPAPEAPTGPPVQAG